MTQVYEMFDKSNCHEINGNYWEKELYDYEEAFQLSKTLVRCTNCYNCENCEDCSDCAGCRNCYNCENCISCFDSEHCKMSNRLVNCRNCVYCNDCESCESCRDCLECKNLKRCKGCENVENKTNRKNIARSGYFPKHEIDTKKYIKIGDNYWSSDYFSEDEALAMSKTLKNCKDCLDCANCENCVNCTSCWDCKDCQECAWCFSCKDSINSFDCEIGISLDSCEGVHGGYQMTKQNLSDEDLALSTRVTDNIDLSNIKDSGVFKNRDLKYKDLIYSRTQRYSRSAD